MSKPQQTQKQLRRANRGNIPGLIGTAELAKLTGKPAPAPLGPLPAAKAAKR